MSARSCWSLQLEVKQLIWLLLTASGVTLDPSTACLGQHARCTVLPIRRVQWCNSFRRRWACKTRQKPRTSRQQLFQGWFDLWFVFLHSRGKRCVSKTPCISPIPNLAALLRRIQLLLEYHQKRDLFSAKMLSPPPYPSSFPSRHRIPLRADTLCVS